MEDEEKRPMTCSEAGKLGAAAWMEKHGVEGYQAIGAKGGAKLKAERGPDYFRELGKRGGAAFKAKYGDEGYQELGRKGGARMSAIVAAGKKALAEKEQHGE